MKSLFAIAAMCALSINSAVAADVCYSQTSGTCSFVGGDVWDAHQTGTDLPGYENLPDQTYQRFNAFLRNTTVCSGTESYYKLVDPAGLKGGGFCGSSVGNSQPCGYQKRGSTGCGEQ